MELFPTLEAPSTTMRYEFLAGTFRVQFPVDIVFIIAWTWKREWQSWRKDQKLDKRPETRQKTVKHSSVPQVGQSALDESVM